MAALVLLPALVALLYGQSVDYGYCGWDDDILVRDNPILTDPDASSVVAVLRPAQREGEVLYIPVAYFAWMIERALFGADPSVLHFLNLLLHALNGVLVYFLLLNLVRRPAYALLGAAGFVAHPLQVESVAWIMGHRDLLAGSFALSCLLAYGRFGSTGRRYWYALALLTYVLAIFSKPVAAPIPALLILLDYRRTQSWRRCAWWGMVPFLLFALLALKLNLAMDAPGYGHAPGFFERLLCLPWLVWHWGVHVFLLAAPVAFHPWPAVDSLGTLALLGVPSLLVLLALFVLAWRRSWDGLWQGLLALAIGFAPAVFAVLQGTRSFVTADRYGYLPLVAVCALLASALIPLKGRWRTSATVLLVAWLIGAAVVTQRAVKTWSSGLTLWTRVLEVYPDERQALVNRGNEFGRAGRYPEAWADYSRALERYPEERLLLWNVARLHLDWKRPEKAIEFLRRYLAAGPGDAETYIRLGDAQVMAGRPAEAISAYRQAERLAPSDPRTAAAVTHATLLASLARLRVDEGDVEALITAALMYERRRELDKSVRLLRLAIRDRSPQRANAFFHLGRILLATGSAEAGRSYLRAALKEDPGHAEARRLLAR